MNGYEEIFFKVITETSGRNKEAFGSTDISTVWVRPLHLSSLFLSCLLMAVTKNK